MHRNFASPLPRFFLCAGLILSLTAPVMAARVLYLGDSLSMGAFGRTLDDQLRTAEHDVFTYVTGGATPYYWLSIYAPIACSIGHWEKTPAGESRRKYIKAVPKIEALLERHRPDVIVVQTGVNLYATLRSKRRSKQENVAELTNLLENMCKTIAADGRRVYWIAPPDSHPQRYPVALQEEMLAITKRVVSGYGFVYESRRVTKFTDPFPQTDGIHYGPTEAREWAMKVSSHLVPWIGEGRKRSRGPFIASRPPEPAPAPREKAPQPPAAPPPPPKAIPVATAAAAVAAKPAPPQAEEIPAPQTQPAPAAPDVFVVKKARPHDYPSEVVTVDIILRSKTPTPHMNEVPYRSGFAVYEWEVVDVENGHYPHRFIRIAHPVIWNGQRMTCADFQPGKRWSLELAFLSNYPSLEQLQIIDELEPNFALPIYIAKL